VLLINPDNIYTYYNRAITRHQLEDFRGAISDYTRAIELFPDFAGAYINRSDARRQIGDEKGAYLDYEKAYQIVEYVNAGQLDSALVMKRYTDSTYFDRIIEFEADFNSFRLDEEIAEAVIDLENAFSMQYIPDENTYVTITREGYYVKEVADINSTNQYGLKFAITNKSLDLSLHDAYRQISLADSILRYEEGGPYVYLFKGIINGMVQNFKTAILEYDRALELDPELELAYLNRAQIYFEMAEQQFMERKYSSAVTITWGEMEPEMALADLDKLIEINPENGFAYFNRANIKVRLQDYDGAVQDYTRAIERINNYAEAIYNRGLTLVYLKEKRKACADLSKAGELGLKQAYRVISRYCK
jgi:tetratricopeptide (TPR) repeat protein